MIDFEPAGTKYTHITQWQRKVKPKRREQDRFPGLELTTDSKLYPSYLIYLKNIQQSPFFRTVVGASDVFFSAGDRYRHPNESLLRVALWSNGYIVRHALDPAAPVHPPDFCTMPLAE